MAQKRSGDKGKCEGSFEMNLKTAIKGHNDKLYDPVDAHRRRKILRISVRKMAQKRFGYKGKHRRQF